MLLRDALGETLRDARTRQNRTLRDVSLAANVSLGYLSEVERGRKEASSELLASICEALDVELSSVLNTVSQTLRNEVPVAPVPVGKSAVTANSAKTGLDQRRPINEGGLRIVLPYGAGRAGASVA